MLTTSICSTIAPVCCGGSLMSTAQFESSLLVTADVALNSYAAPWNSSWLAAGNRNPNARVVQSSSHRSRSNVRVDVDVDEQEALIRDMRRNPEKYQDQ